MHKLKNTKNLHNYATTIMQRVFAAFYAIYKNIVLKHCYNKQTMLQRDSSFWIFYAYLEIKCDFGVFELMIYGLVS